MNTSTEQSAAEPGSLPIERRLAQELSVKPHQVWAAIRLLDAGATVPFIARYRKEATGGLSDTHLRLLHDRLEYLRALEAQRRSAIDAIERLGKLTPALREALEKAQTKKEVEDLYLPFRPKKNSRAEAARAAGLEPLASALLRDASVEPALEAQKYLSEIKGVASIEQALGGARDILAETFSENAALVGFLRDKFWNEGWLYARAAEEKAQMPDAQTYRDYFDYREAFAKIPSHRLLAIWRGRKEGFLSVRLESSGLIGYTASPHDESEYVHEILSRMNVRLGGRPRDRWILETAQFIWKTKLRIGIEIDTQMRLKKRAEEEAIRVFAENLRHLLLAAPAGARPVLGLDPGLRTGVKAACVDKTGKVLECAVLYPHPPEEDLRGAAQSLKNLIARHGVEWVAIGNGTASRETERFVQQVLAAHPELGAKTVVVSEAGASVYSASETASRELPELDVTLRGAVSIARRLQDPLAELVKIEPKAIGVGQYQHDVNPVRLETMLRNVVEDCVNAVGVDVNTASPALLSYVSGLNRLAAERLVEFRNTHGPFRTREALKSVSGIGERTFEQAAGFLRIAGGDNPLDRSGVHPEAYALVERILERRQAPLERLLGNPEALRGLDPAEFADEAFGVPTVRDILAELEKPGRDPRPEFRTASFDARVTAIEHLTPGMILEGVVTNVARFGAFIDVGVHQDGLVHVSQMAGRFVEDPSEIVKVGQIVKVRVLEVDKPRRRIALSLRLSAEKAKN